MIARCAACGYERRVGLSRTPIACSNCGGELCGPTLVGQAPNRMTPTPLRHRTTAPIKGFTVDPELDIDRPDPVDR